MNNDVLKIRNSSYDKYSELLLKRDIVRKAALHYQIEYTGVFGNLIIAVFNEKLECIRKKKTIEYCRAMLNHGQEVVMSELRTYLDTELSAMREQLGSLVENYDAAKNSTDVAARDMLKIKSIFRELAKRMHPDLNPVVEDVEELKDLWNRIYIAYNRNDLKELEELEVLANAALEKLGQKGENTIIPPNLELKIMDLENEIKDIMERDPYAYKYILDDPGACREKKKDYEEELRFYKEYSSELDEVIKEMGIDTKDTGWQLN